jgi:hypothetical protein
MRKSILLAIVALGSIHAQVWSQTSPASKQLVVNGRYVKAKVLDMEGKHFVAVEDLAQGLGGTVGYSDGQITLTFSQPSPPNSSRSESGRVKGTLTYFFNRNYGNKPDTGSEVWLIEGHADIPDNEFWAVLNDMLFVGSANANSAARSRLKNTTGGHKIAKHTIADGNGNFDLLDVPTGHYTLILKSNHTKGLTLRDARGKVRSRDVQVKAGETLDASMDFDTTF